MKAWIRKQNLDHLEFQIDIYNCISEKREYYGSHMVIVHVCVHGRIRRDCLVFNLQATFLLRFL